MNTKDALKMASIVIDGLDTIQSLTRLGGPAATAALASISHLVGVLQAGAAGKASPEEIERDLAALRSRLAGNDADADTALDAKFKGKP